MRCGVPVRVFARCSHGQQVGWIVLSFGLLVPRRHRNWILDPARPSAETTSRPPKVCRAMMGRPKPKMVLLGLGLVAPVRSQDLELELVRVRAQEMNQDVGHFGRRWAV
jgi:hypothetical protein